MFPCLARLRGLSTFDGEDNRSVIDNCFFQRASVNLPFRDQLYTTVHGDNQVVAYIDTDILSDSFWNDYMTFLPNFKF